MLNEFFSINGQKPNIDKENNRLNNIIVMSTEFNHNKNANFTRKNQEELVALGNSEKVYCYLGHSKKGVRSEDRLIDRVGHYENFRIDETKVKADLVFSSTIDTNPNLISGFKEYIFALAENESKDCGFSMSVGMSYNEDDTVTIGALYSVDIVEEPALTLGMFSKEEIIMEDVHDTLTQAFDQFNALDTAIKQGQPIQELLDTLLSSLTALKGEEEAETTPTQAEEEPTIEEAPVSVEESPVEDETKEDETITEIKNQIDELVKSMEEMKSVIMSFSKTEDVKEEPKKKPATVFSVIAPLPHLEEEKTKNEHLEEFSRLRKQGKYSEAAKYHEQFLN